MKDEALAPLRTPEPRVASAWHAHLALRLERRKGATVLTERRHHGPLVVQKSLHPEGADLCQVIIVHPPGGIAGGDGLTIDIDVGQHARAQLVTPAAAKWYRSAGAPAHQDVRLRARAGSTVEWLPHESIVFDGSNARTSTTLHLEGDAAAIAWDVVSLGRVAAGERFVRGTLSQRVEVVRDGALVWVEQSVVAGASPVLTALAGLAEMAAFGTMLLVAPTIDMQWLAIARAIGSDIASHDRAVTHVPGVMIARCRSASAHSVQTWFRRLWHALRAQVIGRDPIPPRLWQT